MGMKGCWFHHSVRKLLMSVVNSDIVLDGRT
jgi:hypothetical protein